MLHLHRLERDEALALGDGVARGDFHRGDTPGHRGKDRAVSDSAAAGSGGAGGGRQKAHTVFEYRDPAVHWSGEDVQLAPSFWQGHDVRRAIDRNCDCLLRDGVESEAERCAPGARLFAFEMIIRDGEKVSWRAVIFLNQHGDRRLFDHRFARRRRKQRVTLAGDKPGVDAPGSEIGILQGMHQEGGIGLQGIDDRLSARFR